MSRCDAQLEFAISDLEGDVCLLDVLIDTVFASQDWELVKVPKIEGFALYLLSDDQEAAFRQAVINVRRDMRELHKLCHGPHA